MSYYSYKFGRNYTPEEHLRYDRILKICVEAVLNAFAYVSRLLVASSHDIEIGGKIELRKTSTGNTRSNLSVRWNPKQRRFRS